MLYSQDGHLQVRIKDGSTGKPTPVRIRMVNDKGITAPLPAAAIGIMYGRNDAAEGYAFQPDSAFYADGMFEVTLQPGTYHIKITKGFEYLEQQDEIRVEPGEKLSRNYVLERWINMPSLGWFSADDHIHIRRSPRENPYILQWVAAEDIHVGAMLQMGDFWTTYYAQYAWGEEGTYQEGQHLLTAGQEDPRTHEVGHTILLTADDQVRFRSHYYLYDSVFDRVHELGGLNGYAHQGMSFNGHRGMTLDILTGKIDFLELLQFCVPDGPLHLDHYYHYLDLGYPITATAGSDFPWCGKNSNSWDAQIGNVRYYTYVGDSLSFGAWKKGFKAGHTFVTSGPMLDLRVNDKLPGDVLKIQKGASVRIEVVASGHVQQVPLEALEIIVHGKAIKRITHVDPGQTRARLHIALNLPVHTGIWIAAKCQAGALQAAHTTPVYVTVDDNGFINRETAPHYLDLSEQYLQELEGEIQRPNDWFDRQAWRYGEALQNRIDEARTVLGEIRGRLD
jgi:hypothetical protein